MPSWKVYRPTFDPTSKERRELDIEPFDIDDDFVRNLINNVSKEFVTNPQLRGELGVANVFIEGSWYFQGKPVIFLESADLVRGLWETNYKIDFDSICLPMNVLSFSFPDDVEIEGMKLPPVIFHKMPTLDGGIRVSSVVRERFSYGQVTTICNQEHLERVMKYEDLAEIPRTDFEVQFNEKDSKLHAVLFRLCIGICSYISAFPGCLRKGLPEAINYRDSRILLAELNRVSPVTLGLHERFRQSPSAHFRAGHFRTLRDDKYKRNPDGTYRTVWVSEAYVAGKIDAYTATEKEK